MIGYFFTENNDFGGLFQGILHIIRYLTTLSESEISSQSQNLRFRPKISAAGIIYRPNNDKLTFL